MPKPQLPGEAALMAVCPECLCDAPLHAASCSSVPPPRRREVDWPVVLIAALVLVVTVGMACSVL